MSTARELMLPEMMTERTQNLRKILWDRAVGNRKDEWIDKKNLPDLSELRKGQSKLPPVIIRRAQGIEAVLGVLTDPAKHPKHSYEISPGELLVGVLPMGSHGLGKVFPEYLDREERHMASIANRSELSVVGHNVTDYKRLVRDGMRPILEFCKGQIQELKEKLPAQANEDKINFYEAVIISCNAVINYAHRFAELATSMAEEETCKKRKDELLEIARICRKVPLEKADTFQEALQSILFLQIGLRAAMHEMSLGRLDQTLQPFLASSLERNEISLEKAVELVECFAIKAAGPLNLSVEHLCDQDHVDYGITMGTKAWYADQRGNVNQYLQNVVVGGKDPDGADATVDCTHVIIQAFSNVNLTTPGLYVRLHDQSPEGLLDRAARAIAQNGCILSVLNDDVIIPGLVTALTEDGTLGEADAIPLAYDYCADGCWEPILNGECDWTFNMINGMTILECSLNEGATLSSDPMVLRGGKRSYRTPPVTSYHGLEEALRTTMDFFVYQSAVAMYNYYLIDEYVIPSPLFSAFLGSCLERGRDKSWGGAKYFLGGTVLVGLPNMVNSIAAIHKWVFTHKKYKLQDVLGAYRYNFQAPETFPERQALYSDIHADFSRNSPKFGNNDRMTKEIARLIIDVFDESVKAAKKFADSVYRDTPDTPEEAERVRRLRMTAGYFGPSLEERLGEDEITTIAATAGLGSFATYVLMGLGTAASADRLANEPLAMNNTPAPGTVERGVAHTLAELKDLDLGRFAAGAPVDLCLELPNQSVNEKTDIVRAVVTNFLENNGHTLSLTLASTEQYREIYDLAVRASENDEKAAHELLNWGHVLVRAGGWQTPFITMSLAQQKHYTHAPVAPGERST